MIEILRHFVGLSYGIGACLACFAVCYLCGLALLPKDGDEGSSQCLDASPAVIGAALYVLLCWFGIRRGIRLTSTIAAFGGIAVMLVALRYRRVSAGLRARAVVSRSAGGWLLAFALLYAIGYVFITPSVNGEYLPLTTFLNLDVYWYLTYTRYLQELGRSNVAGYSFLGDVYLQTPAVFYLIGLLSRFFGQDPLSAAMPVLFGCIGMIGLLAARLSRTVFSVSRLAAVAIGCILVSGPFFRYVSACYFVSTMLATPVFVHLLWRTAADRTDGRIFDLRAVESFAAHYVLLLLLYPVFLFAAVGAQGIVLALTGIAEGQSEPSWRAALSAMRRPAVRTMCAMIGGVGIVAALVGHQLIWAFQMARYLSQKGIAGWSMDLISPLALFGVPGPIDQDSPMTEEQRILSLSVLCVIAVALTVAFFWTHRTRTTVLERTFAGIAAGTLVAYCFYFLQLGPSYQQWKFASYFPLPWTFVVFAGGLRLVSLTPAAEKLTRTTAGRRGSVAVLATVAMAFVGGNMLIRARFDPQLLRPDGSLRNLASIDQLPSFRELYVQMDGTGPTMLAAYFIRTKTLHMVSRSHYAYSPVPVEVATDRRPFLIQRVSCADVGHDQTHTIEGVGCLLFAPPSIAFDRSYSLGRTFAPIALTGFSAREPSGRWNGQDAVEMAFTADVQQAPITGKAFINLHVSPHRPGNVAGQRLQLSWGDRRSASAWLTDPGWISLPLEWRDWVGGPRLATLIISMAFPDAVPASRFDPNSVDRRPLAVWFADASFSTTARGRVIQPAGGPAR
ncbi:MAG: hypothetical protein NTY02_04655 [Acidobacteria bacterium]|nr:hypothetical protein [Acidobacteriota bacterium]